MEFIYDRRRHALDVATHLGDSESVRVETKVLYCRGHDIIELCLKLVDIHLPASPFQLLLQFVPLILAGDIKLRENDNKD
jgi:hypothetical protein